MSNQKAKIVLNGKVYDLKTGKSTQGINTAKYPKIAASGSHVRKTNPKTIDGVIPKSNHHKPTKNTHHKPIFNSHSEPNAFKASETNTINFPHSSLKKEHNINHIHQHKPEKTATLMRSVVSRPDTTGLITSREHATVGLIDKADRLKRAKSIKQSQHIKRFPTYMQTAEDFVATPIIEVQKDQPIEQTHPHNLSQNNETTHTNDHKKTRQEKIFEKAIENANTHKTLERKNHQKHHRATKNPKRRSFRYAGATLASLLLIGFVLYQNIPNLSMRIASSKAGFNASLPAYNPSGYALSGPVVYSPGKITINFSSNSDDRSYTMTQQVSNWNSQALIDNYFAVNNMDFETYQEKGKTIFIYDNANATWVSGGVWYQIQGANQLNSDQLLKIASST